MAPASNRRVIAFYLPQFHPIPENDAWWGKGFTEWTNVAKAKPLFPGHYQPHLPGELGFYDLRVPEVREAQANLAREYGIAGFCYWHYWFMGKRLLNRPLDEVLASGRPNFPFCVGWANESWTRRWTGEEKEILLKQEYSSSDDLAHARWLADVFSDTRYIRVNGRPLFVLYRPPALPDAKRTLDTLRGECARLGVPEPYIVGRDTHTPGVDLRDYGCDITESSSPNLGVLPGAFCSTMIPSVEWVSSRFRDLKRNLRSGVFDARLKIYDYEDACQLMEEARPTHPHVPGFFVGWDNTPRRGRDAIIMRGSTPEAFGRRVRVVLEKLNKAATEPKLLFLNAWNEWAEGMHLEPDQRYGHGFLQALKSELQKQSCEVAAPLNESPF